MKDVLGQLPDDEALDRLLAEARWPEPGEASQRRVLQAYHEARSVRLWLPLTYAAAAAIVLALVIGGLIVRRDQSRRVVVNSEPHLPAPSEVPAVAVRAPTMGERAILLTAQPPVKRANVATRPHLLSLSDGIAQVIAGGDPDEIAKLLATNHSAGALERSLLQRRGSANAAVSDACSRLLLEVASIETLSALAQQTGDAEMRTRLFSALLRRDPQRASESFLRFVEDPQRSDEALAALHAVPRDVIEQMFRRLDDPSVRTRMAAARVLGRIDGPVITQRLAQMVWRNENRREALAALVSSGGSDAASFVAKAKRQVALASEIRAVETELNNPS